MKPNDIIMIFTDPAECENEEGRAKLIRLVKDFGIFERWEVEFLDSPDKTWERLIKKL